MAKQKTKVTTVTTTKKRTRKTGSDSGYRKCNICHGTGRVKKS